MDARGVHHGGSNDKVLRDDRYDHQVPLERMIVQGSTFVCRTNPKNITFASVDEESGLCTERICCSVYIQLGSALRWRDTRNKEQYIL